MRVDDDPKKEALNEEMASQFRLTTTQLLFLCLRARPDIQTAVSFFTTRVRYPDMDGRLEEAETLYEVPEVHTVHEVLFERRQSHKLDVVG